MTPENVFESFVEPAQLKPIPEAWLMIYRDQPIQMQSNQKFRWAKRSHALNALTLQWKYFMQQARVDQQRPYQEYRQLQHDFKQWIKENITFIRQVDFEKQTS